ncbi:hypothetical protein HD553DRAFT_323761 [Filobasidium floriforme]|uniref:uncharacterized protein n=1 Tax=Filobasidium floriforme TaxID=5210 RepID=UPI001E8CAA48|nr:uncharacterized protein HD553DRAFT_323761 [Filobasidium floriforme]KAH8085182.1 hypothetical protein HD553DRAFT_323761 [Filobasidium floriforme]
MVASIAVTPYLDRSCVNQLADLALSSAKTTHERNSATRTDPCSSQAFDLIESKSEPNTIDLSPLPSICRSPHLPYRNPLSTPQRSDLDWSPLSLPATPWALRLCAGTYIYLFPIGSSNGLSTCNLIGTPTLAHPHQLIHQLKITSIMSYLIARSPSLQADTAGFDKGERHIHALSPNRRRAITGPLPLRQEASVEASKQMQSQRPGLYKEARVPVQALGSGLSASPLTPVEKNKVTIKRARLSNGVANLKDKGTRQHASKATAGGTALYTISETAV